MIKTFSSAMIAACGMGIHLREDRPSSITGKDLEGGQCDWRKAVGITVDALDFDKSGKLDSNDLARIDNSELSWLNENKSKEATKFRDVLDTWAAGGKTADNIVRSLDYMTNAKILSEELIAEIRASFCWFKREYILHKVCSGDPDCASGIDDANVEIDLAQTSSTALW